MNDDVICPYCNKAQEINHDDGHGYDEGCLHQQECECGKIFTYTTSISFYYEAYKAECLNGGEHDYRPTNTYPPEFTKMRCTICEDERRCTAEEMAKLMKT